MRGLLLEGGAWDADAGCLADARPMQGVGIMPVVHFQPAVLTTQEWSEVRSQTASLRLYQHAIHNSSRAQRGQSTVVETLQLPMPKTGPPSHKSYWLQRMTALALATAT